MASGRLPLAWVVINGVLRTHTTTFTPRKGYLPGVMSWFYGLWTPEKVWVMGYHKFMGFPPFPDSGMAKMYGVSGDMGYKEYGL